MHSRARILFASVLFGWLASASAATTRATKTPATERGPRVKELKCNSGPQPTMIRVNHPAKLVRGGARKFPLRDIFKRGVAAIPIPKEFRAELSAASEAYQATQSLVAEHELDGGLPPDGPVLPEYAGFAPTLQRFGEYLQKYVNAQLPDLRLSFTNIVVLRHGAAPPAELQAVLLDPGRLLHTDWGSRGYKIRVPVPLPIDRVPPTIAQDQVTGGWAQPSHDHLAAILQTSPHLPAPDDGGGRTLAVYDFFVDGVE
jgi:hypothetical protein